MFQLHFRPQEALTNLKMAVNDPKEINTDDNNHSICDYPARVHARIAAAYFDLGDLENSKKEMNISISMESDDPETKHIIEVWKSKMGQ